MMRSILMIITFLLLWGPLHAQQLPIQLVESDSYAEFQLEQPEREYPDPAPFYIPLKAYLSPFTAQMAYSFSFLRYRPRGYDFRQQTLSLQGIDLEDPFSGNPPWSLVKLAGEIPNATYLTEGFLPPQDGAGGIAGGRQWILDPSQQPRGGRASYLFTDRKFRQGFRVNLNSAEIFRGWFASFGGSRRWGRDRHITGVFADDYLFYAALQKRWKELYTLTFTHLIASTEQGMRGASSKEVFELTGNPLYHSYWGPQGEEVRNARVRTNLDNMSILNWTYTPRTNLKFRSALSYLGAKRAYSGLDGYGTHHPYPDYYRYLPSFASHPFVHQQVEQAWRAGDPDQLHIRWEELYGINRSNGSGPAGYVLGSDMTHQHQLRFCSMFQYNPLGVLELRGGVRARMEQEHYFRRLDDLLGGAYLLDIDQFLIDDAWYGDQIENNLLTPGRRVTQGQAYRYSYDLKHRALGGWVVGALNHQPDALHWRGYGALEMTQKSFFRIGHYEKELFPGARSYGPSEQVSLVEYLIKAGASYLFVPDHGFDLHVALGDQAPLARHLFLSPLYQNRVVDHSATETILAGQAGYRFGNRALQLELRGYITRFQDGQETHSLYDDVSGEYANVVIREIRRLHSGLELGILLRFTHRLSLQAAGVWSNFTYLNNPQVEIYADKGGEVLVRAEATYLKGYRIGGSPQQLCSGELRYWARGMWNLSVSVNHAAHYWITPNPLRRMNRVIDQVELFQYRAALLDQQRFDPSTTINLFVSKSIRVRASDFITLSGSINNLANCRQIIYSGYEPMRIARQGVGAERTFSPFASRYQYAYGRSYYITLSYRF